MSTALALELILAALALVLAIAAWRSRRRRRSLLAALVAVVLVEAVWVQMVGFPPQGPHTGVPVAAAAGPCHEDANPTLTVVRVNHARDVGSVVEHLTGTAARELDVTAPATVVVFAGRARPRGFAAFVTTPAPPPTESSLAPIWCIWRPVLPGGGRLLVSPRPAPL